jgi:hypothetical protein
MFPEAFGKLGYHHISGESSSFFGPFERVLYGDLISVTAIFGLNLLIAACQVKELIWLYVKLT